MDDFTLIRNIKEKNEKASESIRELSERHSGVFHMVLNRFTSHPNFQNLFGVHKEDIKGEKESIIYDAALKFDEERGVQFNTYLGNNLRYYLLGKYKANERYFYHNYESEETPTAYEVEEDWEDFHNKEILEKVFKVLDSFEDKRIPEIFRIRYKNGKNPTSWKDVEKELGGKISYEWCRVLHNKALDILKIKLKNFTL